MLFCTSETNKKILKKNENITFEMPLNNEQKLAGTALFELYWPEINHQQF